MVDVSGTIDDVLEQVDGDAEKALEAYDAETTGKGRSTLLSQLQDIIDAASEPPAGEDEGAGEPGVSPDASPVGSTPGDHAHVAAAKSSEPVYIARKKLHVPGKVYMPGDVVVEAPSWKRVEGYVRTGYLEVSGE